MLDIFKGEMIRLTAEEPETIADAEFSWQGDSEYHRLGSDYPQVLFSAKKLKDEYIQKAEASDKQDRYFFSARTIENDRLIGFIGFIVDVVHSEAMMGLAIGERDHWGKGYGTDMMRVTLRYMFLELNLARVTLSVYEYNPRALRSYEKAGFRIEGKTRSERVFEGRRFDAISMGILREEWEALQKGHTS